MIVTITKSLDDLRKAIDGLVTMSNELDLVFKKMFDNKVPDSWAKVSYPSLKVDK
jgi:dynein heavy chain